MSVSSTFTSAVTTLMSAIVISVEPSEFWMPITTASPSRTHREDRGQGDSAWGGTVRHRVSSGAQSAGGGTGDVSGQSGGDAGGVEGSGSRHGTRGAGQRAL